MSGREEKLGTIRRRNVGKVDEKEESEVSKKLAKFDVFYKVEESVVESKKSSRGFLRDRIFNISYGQRKFYNGFFYF